MGKDGLSRVLKTKQKHWQNWQSSNQSENLEGIGREIERQAGGNAPRGKATRRDKGYQAESAKSGTGSSRRLSEEPSQGGEIGPDIGEEDEGLAAGLSVDGEAFEEPLFEGRVATLGGVASTVIEAFPGWRTDGDVADEAASPVFFEGEANIENLTVVGVGVEIGALGGTIW